MELSNVELAKTICDNNINDYPYKYINNRNFNPDLIPEYFDGFMRLGIMYRNDFIKNLYNIYRDNETPNMGYIKQKIYDFAQSNNIFNSFINHCDMSIAIRDYLITLTNGISTILHKHKMNIYGRYLNRVYNGLITNDNVDVISVLCNDKNNVLPFYTELAQKYEVKAIKSSFCDFIFIKGLNIILKIRYDEEKIQSFINKSLPSDQLFMSGSNHLQYTKTFYQFINNLYDLSKYDFSAVYYCINTYYKHTDKLKKSWNEPMIASDLCKLINSLSSCNHQFIDPKKHYL